MLLTQEKKLKFSNMASEWHATVLLCWKCVLVSSSVDTEFYLWHQPHVVEEMRTSTGTVSTWFAHNTPGSSSEQLSMPLLKHLGWDKMAAISQTTPLNTFSWMKMLEFRLKFHWRLFLRVQLTIFQHCFSKIIIIGSSNGLSPVRHQAIILTNAAI